MVGPFANDYVEILGSYTPWPPVDDIVTALKGLQSLADSVQFAEGCPISACTNYSSEAVKKAVIGTQINFVLLGTGLLAWCKDCYFSQISCGVQETRSMDVSYRELQKAFSLLRNQINNHLKMHGLYSNLNAANSEEFFYNTSHIWVLWWWMSPLNPLFYIFCW